MTDKRKFRYRGALIALILAAASILPMGCSNSEKTGPVGETPATDNDMVAVPDAIEPEYVEGEELLCLADSREQAQEIADQYGIELVNFSYGVATFHTTEDPQKIIDMGKEKGYPELSLNGYSHILE